ncbi:MAG: tol-pal system-associated acyl-CoA thioesterase [Casimicrobiaceae bacterium]
MPFSIAVRIYYEDTDVAGVVYYANYLRFLERARTEWLRAAGWDLTALQRDQDAVFVVRRVEADYLAPARLNDLLTVTCEPEDVGRARIVIHQRVLRGDQMLLDARVTAAYVGATDGRPKAMPPALRQSMSPRPLNSPVAATPIA